MTASTSRILSQSLLVFLWAVLIACTQNAQPGSVSGESTSLAKQKKIRVHVGEIKEIRMRSPADTSLQMIATSENHEVVDVSRKQAPQESADLKPGRLVPMVYLLKGVTAGTAKVIFSEKPSGLNAQERHRKTYLVQVVNK